MAKGEIWGVEWEYDIFGMSNRLITVGEVRLSPNPRHLLGGGFVLSCADSVEGKMPKELYAEVDGERVRVIRAGADVVIADISETDFPRIGRDAGGRTRVSQITTLGDYKILNEDRPLLIETIGTGSGTYTNSKYNMHVEAGQYIIRTSRRFHAYFSGKCQIVEQTFDTFGLQPGIVKRVGYFSSSHTGTYSTNYDGYWLESNGVTGSFYLVASRKGVETIRIPWQQWNNYEKVENYNWNNFSVVLSDFLWLGGAALNLSMKIEDEFVLLHSVPYAGLYQDVFIQSPNQPMRYEIRSEGGVGDFRYICAQVGTEGSIEEAGLSRFIYSGTTGTVAQTINTTYPIKAVRKQSAKRDIASAISDVSLFVTSANDNLLWTLQVNPTLSAPLSYSNVANSSVQEANGNGTITVTSQGTVIAGGIITTNAVIPNENLRKNFLAFLGGSIQNVMDEYVLCATPLTSGITVFAGISIKEY